MILKVNYNTYFHTYPLNFAYSPLQHLAMPVLSIHVTLLALFVEGYEGAADFLRSEPSIDLILVTDDRKIYYSNGIAESFTNISSMEAEVIPLD